MCCCFQNKYPSNSIIQDKKQCSVMTLTQKVEICSVIAVSILFVGCHRSTELLFLQPIFGQDILSQAFAGSSILRLNSIFKLPVIRQVIRNFRSNIKRYIENDWTQTDFFNISQPFRNCLIRLFELILASFTQSNVNHDRNKRFVMSVNII